mmetsp:Transcript_31850/g.69708  ORF Transcript_31850/g.69708 Transcript_31850/m.69708 type:complete len:263 (+) Transcript_31850:254-1042(+)
MLRLHAESRALGVLSSTLALEVSSKKIARIKLHSRLGSFALHPSAGHKLPNNCTRPKSAGSPVDAEVVVVARAILQLHIFLRHARANLIGRAKIKRRALNTGNLPCGDRDTIDWGEAVAEQLHLVVINCPKVSVTAKIEVAVIRQINNCFLICCCRIIHCQCIPLNRKSNNCSESAGIPLLHVGRLKSKAHRLSTCADNIPHSFVKTHISPMQRISIIILRELVLLSQEQKLTLLDSVCVATDSGSEIWQFLGAVLFQIITA